MAQEKLEKDASCYVVVFAEPFVKKEIGEIYFPEFQLLDICPKRKPGLKYSQAKITITRDGKKIETAFDVVKTFANQKDAREFVEKYGVRDESLMLYEPPKCKIIRVVGLPLQKRADAKPKPTIALLDTCLSEEARERAHPAITFEENGKRVSRIFEVIKTFADKTEAERYAKENSIRDVEISEEYTKYVADCRIIRVVELPLSKRPNVPTAPKIALLDTCLNDPIPQQRPVIEVMRGGKKAFREYDIIKIFADRAEAESYARENGISDADFNR
jgi:hypothetical protein